MSVKNAQSQPQPPALQQDSVSALGTSSAANATALAPEMEQILTSLTSHRSVLGYLLLSRGHPATLIRHSGVVFEGEQGRRYAHAVSRIVEATQEGLDEVTGEGDNDEVRFMRIRTKRHELMISPDERYLLAVLHDPAS